MHDHHVQSQGQTIRISVKTGFKSLYKNKKNTKVQILVRLRFLKFVFYFQLQMTLISHFNLDYRVLL